MSVNEDLQSIRDNDLSTENVNLLDEDSQAITLNEIKEDQFVEFMEVKKSSGEKDSLRGRSSGGRKKKINVSSIISYCLLFPNFLILGNIFYSHKLACHLLFNCLLLLKN